MATSTVTAAEVLATADLDNTPTVETLRAAIEAYNTAGDTSSVAGATLAALTLARYAYHAQHFAVDYKGTSILPESDRREVARLITLDATGRTELPNKGNGLTRSPASISLGQYISRYGTVATSFDFGIQSLAGVDSAKDAYKQISEGTSATKIAAADKALTVWMSGLIESERKALAVAIDVLQSESATAHRAAFSRLINPAK